jgi:hypothetical protein
VNELPHSIALGETLKERISSHPNKYDHERSLAVEMSVFASPHFMYAMLGAIFRPAISDNLLISIPICEALDTPFSDSIAWHGDHVFWGLPGYYARAILKTVQNYNAMIGAGTLDFRCAAHAEVASNDLMFACLSQTLLVALSNNLDADAIAKTALQQNLNEDFAFLRAESL